MTYEFPELLPLLDTLSHFSINLRHAPIWQIKCHCCAYVLLATGYRLIAILFITWHEFSLIMANEEWREYKAKDERRMDTGSTSSRDAWCSFQYCKNMDEIRQAEIQDNTQQNNIQVLDS